ncbi:hypothetical protein SH2C18_15080 [Clostridium sediminicola]|uniref:hypothetical protein n=1 Tax=Clostridium sediminicola TaxID=3114879 RepID=UPI0031F2775A
MLNADGLVGSTGDLLSHNIFMYCKNNAVNMSDPSGFREIQTATLAEETEEMRKVSLAAMSNISHKGKSIKNQISTLNSMSNDLMNNAQKYGKEASENEDIVLGVSILKWGVITYTGTFGRIGARIAGTMGLGNEIYDNRSDTSINEHITQGLITSGNFRAAAELSESHAILRAWDSIKSVFKLRPLRTIPYTRMKEKLN